MTLMLLDSASLWYRAYYGMPDTLLSPTGMPVNAIRGYLDMTARLISMYSPNRIVACIEGDWRPSWRVDLFPAYKANRLEDDSDAEEEPETLTPQIPVLLDLLDAFGIPMVGVDDYEADDVMATFAVREKGPIRIVTGDRDLFQLVDDKRDIKVVYLAKGISQHDLVDISWVANRYGIPGDRYALFAMFRGDPSDGLPGARGIGPKGAATIANSFATIEEVIEAANNSNSKLSASLQKKILESAEYLRKAEIVVNCVDDLRLPKGPFNLPKKVVNSKALDTLAKSYGIDSSVKRLLSALEL